MTNSIRNITKIDHLSIELRKESTKDLILLEKQIIEILTQYGVRISSKKPYSMTFFDKGYLLYSHSSLSKKRSAGSIKFSTKRLCIKLELNGAQCEKINLNSQGFKCISDLCKNHQAIIRRIDICFDDITGKYNLRRAGQDYSAGQYDSTKGIRPQKKTYLSSGRTLYIGSLNSYKLLRIYDKSAEQKLPSYHLYYKKWVRHELTLRNQGKIRISLSAINNPDGIFLDAYPKAHRKLLKNVTPISIERITAIQTATTISQKIECTRKQRGRTLRLIRDVLGSDSETLNLLVRDGNPSGVILPEEITLKKIRQELVEFFDQNNMNSKRKSHD